MMARQRKAAFVGAAALLLSSSSAFTFSALPSSARRAVSSSRCQQRSSKMKMVASVPKDTTADSATHVVAETRTKPANHRLHVQVCVYSFVCVRGGRLLSRLRHYLALFPDEILVTRQLQTERRLAPNATAPKMPQQGPVLSVPDPCPVLYDYIYRVVVPPAGVTYYWTL